MQDDGYIDLPDNNDGTEDSPAGDDSLDIQDGGSDSSGGGSMDDGAPDIGGDFPALGGADQESGEDSGPENNTDSDGQEPEDDEDDTEDEKQKEGDGESGTESADGTETEMPAVDPEVVVEINAALKEHSASVDGFLSSLSVSENSIAVSLDKDSSALLADVLDRQDQMFSAIDGLNGFVVLIFFVLILDLLHRFAKRIIKNFMGGGRNGTNS